MYQHECVCVCVCVRAEPLSLLLLPGAGGCWGFGEPRLGSEVPAHVPAAHGLAGRAGSRGLCQSDLPGREQELQGADVGQKGNGKNWGFFITEIFIMEFFVKSPNWKRLQFYQGRETLGSPFLGWRLLTGTFYFSSPPPKQASCIFLFSPETGGKGNKFQKENTSDTPKPS